ncbi:MAG: molybdopterin-dependent oxidoreductase [Prolixibacteraceae bacterium]|nr:molybdopterin-dependent oxidoreductase [Prolixibacteraceae bacterium]
MAQKRRDFIKISSLSAAGLIFGSQYLRSSVPDFKKKGLGDLGPMSLQRTPTYCEICFWKCAGWVHKNEDGSIKKVVGNDDDTNCNGRLCPRGTGGVGMYYDQDRLKTPLIRVTGADGKQTFREASWDEALDVVAEKMQLIKEKHGAECTALFTHGSGGHYFGNLLKAFGSGNIAAPSYAQCRGPREVAFIATFGAGLDSPEPTDIRDTRCLVLIGSHLGENMHNGQVQEMSDAIDKGAAIITVDPRFSTVASKSKFWLPIKPATDIALLLAWIHEIIYNEWYDKKYVEKHTSGFEQLKEHVKNYTPEWAFGITTIAPDVIRETAREMRDASPAVIIHPGRHVTWYGDDTQRLRAVAILNALLGSWGRRGGFFIPEKLEVPEFPHPPFPKPTKTWRDAMGGKYFLADLALASGVCDATIPSPDLDCSIKAWIVNGTNLIMTLPDQKKTIEAIKNLELLVVVDTMPMEITGFADVVLPECTYLERWDDIRVVHGRNPDIALRMPATEPLYDTKPAYWIAKKLAEKMGLGDYFKWENFEDVLEWQLQQIGSSLEEMKRIGVKNYPRESGPLYFEEDMPVEFGTDSGKIELYSTIIAAEGFDAMPVYTPHMEPPSGFYHLNYGRAPMHTFGRTANNPNLTDLMDENTVWVNPKVAKEWGLKNEQPVYLENQDGVVSDFTIKVRITERIRFDSVYMVHGFGHNNEKLTRSHGRGASDSQLITRVLIDPIMGGTGMRGNFVTFRFEKESEAKS